LGKHREQPDAIEQLRRAHPGWQISSVWITAASGPDRRRFWASRGDVFISAWSAAAPAAECRKYKFPGDETWQP
jgi:alkanesulfonate monooxygenase SsuD/methylene tetrahydromethanopterin reductase-like flavin-dependent oxidoreductase (luciferase family)